MQQISIRGWEVEILDEYVNSYNIEDLGTLMENHAYNIKTDWEDYKRTGNLWRKKD